MALARLGLRRLPSGVPAAALSQVRFQSTSVPDPKTKAHALIDALPGNSYVTKTGGVVLGTSVAALAISSELYVLNEESIILGGFALLATFIASQVRAPYREWADGQINKISGILNAARSEHTSAVKTRIDSVSEMKDVVPITKGLFALSRDTVKAEHQAFVEGQKVALAAEIKATLDSWVRFEAQAREAEQAELVDSVISKVLADLKDPKTQKEILASAVSDVEALVREKKI